MSGQQQCVIVRLLQGEPNVVHCFEILDVRLSVTHCCFKIPFTQILKQIETQISVKRVWGGVSSAVMEFVFKI